MAKYETISRYKMVQRISDFKTKFIIAFRISEC